MSFKDLNFDRFNEWTCYVCGQRSMSGVFDLKTNKAWCKECFDKYEWPKIQQMTNQQALPAKIYFWLSVIFFVLVVLRFMF